MYRYLLKHKIVIVFLIFIIWLCFLLFFNVSPDAHAGVLLNREEAMAFINKVPRSSTGLFDPASFVLNPDVFPDRFRAAGILWDNFVVIGVRTTDNFYYAVQLCEFDFDAYEKFILPFEADFGSSNMFIIPEDSTYFYEYTNVVIIDPATLNYCHYHCIAVKMPNPSVLSANVNPDITKALYFFKYLTTYV